MSLVCSGHFFSHYLTLALPPLIPFWRDDFGLSYTELGFILTLYAAGTGITQIPLGFLVDRIGALAVVVTGLAIRRVLLALGTRLRGGRVRVRSQMRPRYSVSRKTRTQGEDKRHYQTKVLAAS